MDRRNHKSIGDKMELTDLKNLKKALDSFINNPNVTKQKFKDAIAPFESIIEKAEIDIWDFETPGGTSDEGYLICADVFLIDGSMLSLGNLQDGDPEADIWIWET